MNYPFLLKFSAVTNLSDARYAAGMWADFIGFCFDPSSPDYLEPNKAKEIAGWINGPLVVGEFGHQPKEWIADFVKAIPLHAIQIPSNYSDVSIQDLGLPILLKTETAELTPLMAHAKCLVCDSKEVMAALNKSTELTILYEPKDSSTIEQIDQYAGIALKGQAETAPGTRNHDAWTVMLEPYMD